MGSLTIRRICVCIASQEQSIASYLKTPKNVEFSCEEIDPRETLMPVPGWNGFDWSCCNQQVGVSSSYIYIAKSYDCQLCENGKEM